MNIKIVVATHKKYKMPEDEMYLPVHVGKEGKDDIGYVGDNTGDNISLKNPYYCELTGLYWAWKNLDADYIGLAHYRRHFSNNKRNNDKFKMILRKEELEKFLEDADVVLPKKRKYYIESLYSHYKHTLNVETLDETRKIINENYNEYLETFDKNMKRTYAHMFNMFIMKKEILDEYCKWLFGILTELEKRIDPKKYDSFHARYLGRISELLLDVWIEKNGIKYKEIPVVYMEKVDWIKKGGAFLKAKFGNVKYGKSF